MAAANASTSEKPATFNPWRLQECRILFFTGLPHHYQQLAPLVQRLETLGANLTFATTQNVNFGCDFKGDFEVPLVRAGKDMMFLPERFEAEVANDLVRDYRRAEKMIANAVRQAPKWSQELPVAAVRLRTMIGLDYDRLAEKMLDAVEPELVLVLHEFNCWTRPLCAQSLARGVPVLSFVEGMPYNNLSKGVFTGQFSSKMCLWGESQRRWMLNEGTDPDILTITGPMHLDEAKRNGMSRIDELKAEFELPRDKRILLLVLPRLHFGVPAAEILKSLLEFLDSRDNYFLAVKWHPHERDDEQAAARTEHPRLRSFKEQDVRKLIAVSDVAICTGTSAGAEVLAFDKPLIEVNWNGRNVNLDYADQGVALEVRNAADWLVIDRVLDEGLPPKVRQAAERYVHDAFFKLDGHCVDRAVEQALALLR